MFFNDFGKEFINILLGRRQRWAQAEELCSSFFSNELLPDAYEPQGFGGFIPCGVRAAALVRDNVLKAEYRKKLNFRKIFTFRSLFFHETYGTAFWR